VIVRAERVLICQQDWRFTVLYEQWRGKPLLGAGAENGRRVDRGLAVTSMLCVEALRAELSAGSLCKEMCAAVTGHKHTPRFLWGGPMRGTGPAFSLPGGGDRAPRGPARCQ